MRSREVQRAFMRDHFHLEVLPIHYHEDVVTTICSVLRDRNLPKSELCRLIFTDPRCRFFSEFSQTQVADFLGVSAALVSRCKQQAMDANYQEMNHEQGRPPLLKPTSEEKIREWLREQTAGRNWPTLRAVKEQIVAQLEIDQPNATPSKSYYTHCIERILASEFTVRVAQPLEEERYAVRPEQIEQHFRNLRDLNLQNLSPHLILNLDETGFGASKTGRVKSRKVVIPAGFTGAPVFKESSDSHFITPLCAISAAGDVLAPGLISKRETDHPDASRCSFFLNVRRYTSPKAFVTRDIFTDYLAQIVLPHIDRVREQLGEGAPCLVIFDGHRAHLSEILTAWAAQHHILLYLLPPHSTHLLQPLDQGFFRRLKIQYSLFAPIKDVSKISSSLERIWMAIQATTITRIVWNAWIHTGIICIVKKGECEHCELDPARVLDDPALQPASGGAIPIFEGGRGRGVSTGQFGLLDEDEMLIWDAWQCPFCCHPLEFRS
jgi:transposase